MRCIGIACKSVSILLLCLMAGACRSPDPASPTLDRYEFAQAQMGMPFRAVVYAPNFQTASNGVWAAFSRIRELNQILSDYETESELNKLCYQSGTGKAVQLSPDLWAVLFRAQALARQTDGAFDITVGPYSGLWRKARREKRLPDPRRLEAAKQRVGYEKVLLDPKTQTARLIVPNMRLDLGGIAKGYALDAALQVLRQHGLPRAMVEGGGDIAVWDPPPGRTGWRIEVAPLDRPTASQPWYLSLSRAALASSGDVNQRLEIDRKRYSHIVDPRTGLGLIRPSLVHVIAPDATTADSLATALNVLDVEAGLILIKEYPGVDVSVTRTLQDRVHIQRSPGFNSFIWQP